MIEHPGTNKYGNMLMIQEHLERSLASWNYNTNNENKPPKWAVNNVPKVFRMFPLPTEKLLHHWYQENDNEFGALFEHCVAGILLIYAYIYICIFICIYVREYVYMYICM